MSTEFHTAIYCGQAGGLHLVYDASPRGEVPLFARRDGVAAVRPGDAWPLESARPIWTLYARATETTDRLRNDGGAYLRLWDERERYYHRGLRARLRRGGGRRSGVRGVRGGGPAATSWRCAARPV